jgi:putative aldouronate transport system permease protein
MGLLSERDDFSMIYTAGGKAVGYIGMHTPFYSKSQFPVAGRNLKPSLFRQCRKKWQLLLLLLPGLLYYIIFRYVPMYGIVVAFKDFKPLLGITGSPFVWFAHFERLVNSPDFWQVFRNTLIISVYKIVLFFPVPILLSIMLNEIRHTGGKRLAQTALYLPHFLSWVIFTGVVNSLLSSGGLINYLIELFGGQSHVFLAESKYFRSIIVFTSIWKEAGWNTVIYLAAIAGINPELYEAALMDGAGLFHRIWHITLPCIMSTIIITFIMRLGSVMDAGFEQVLLMYNVSVYDVGDILSTFVYRMGITKGQIGFSTAADLFKGVINLALVWGSNWIIRRIGEEGLW